MSTRTFKAQQQSDSGITTAAPRRSKRRLALLLPVLALLLALAAWVNADSVRRWQYRHATTNDLLHQARQQPADLLLAKLSGQRLLQEGRDEEAHQLLMSPAQSHPQDSELNVLAGRAAWRLGDSKLAGALFKTALQADPGNVDARFWTGELLFQRGRLELAQNLMLDAVRLDPSRSDIWTRLGEVSLQVLDFPTALQRFDRAEKLDPSGRVAWLRGSALQSLGRLPEAEVAARQALNRDPQAQAYVLLAEIVQRSPEDARQREAQGYLQQALEKTPNDANALKLLAINHRSLGEHEQAVKVLRRLLRLVPAQTEAYQMLSQSYQALGRRELAEKTLRIFRRLEPLQNRVDFAQHRVSIQHGALSAHLQHVRALLALGRNDLARQVIERARSKAPDSVELKELSRRVGQPPSIQIEPLPADPVGDAP